MADDLPDAPWAASTHSQDHLEDAPWAKAPDQGLARAIGRGAAQGATFGFSDELKGLEAAKPSFVPSRLGPLPVGPIAGAANLGYQYLTGQHGAADEYSQAVERERKEIAAAKAQHPWGFGGGELAGSLASMAALPAGEFAALPTWGARALQGAQIGAEAGALSGAGEGTDLQSRALGAGTGAVTGAGIGAASAPVGSALEYGFGKTLGPAASTVSGWINPEKQATQRLAAALDADQAAIASGKAQGLSLADWQAKKAAGEPVTLADLGAANTQALLRSAANTSPEARNTLEKVINDRFAGQTERVANDIRGLVSGGANAQKSADQLVAEYDIARTPVYQRAYADGDKSIMTPTMERMMGSPMLTNAMKGAVQSGQDRAILQGYGAFNPGVTFEGGVLKFNRGPNGRETYPNLQYWDAVKRELDDVASSAERSGNKELGSRATQMAKTLRTELDSQVPSYKAARDVAADFFGTRNALEAGQQLAGKKVDPVVIGKLMRKMSPEERELFREGYASDWANRVVENFRDTADVTKAMFNSPAERKRAMAVFGPVGVQKLEARMSLENIMDGARRALGNSTTVRQMIEAGLAGGAVGGYFGGHQGAIEGAVGAAGLVGGKNTMIGRQIMSGAQNVVGYVDRKTASKVADLLMSSDPSKVQQGLAMAGQNRRIAEGLKRIANHVALATGVTERPRSIEQTKRLYVSPGFSRGGRVRDLIAPTIRRINAR